MASLFSYLADRRATAPYVMLAADSSGLDTCMIVSVHPLIQQGAW